MNLHQSLNIIFIFLLALGSVPVWAATEEPALVEVRVPQDTLAPYRERRGNSAFMVGVDYEALTLKNFFSTEDGATYKDIFGTEPIPLVHLSLDYKYNFSLGALALGIDAGMGTLSGNSSRSLDVTKYGAGIKFIADTLMPEPYVAPYVAVNAWRMATKETTTTTSISETTGIGYNYTVGLMIQLDWIDYDTSKQATFNYGLENTYLDVYATQYAKTGDAADVNTETDLLWGAGLKLEF